MSTGHGSWTQDTTCGLVWHNAGTIHHNSQLDHYDHIESHRITFRDFPRALKFKQPAAERLLCTPNR